MRFRAMFGSEEPVYTLEAFYIEGGVIRMQLCNVSRYVALYPLEYRSLLRRFNVRAVGEYAMNRVLEFSVSEDALDGLWEVREIPYTERAHRALMRYSFLFFGSPAGIMNGYDHPDARLYTRELTLIRRTALMRAGAPRQSLSFMPQYSAHVDVGQGNCSFVFDSSNAIGIDCSNREVAYLRNPTDYQPKIDNTINRMRLLQGRTDVPFVLNAFVLTHAHYDHYSGVFEQIRRGYINTQTDFYVNLGYQSQSAYYNNLLRFLINNGFNVIDANAQVATPALTFLAPRAPAVTRGNANEYSVVSRVATPVGDFVFPGDMVAAGWLRLAPWASVVQNARYYAASHHGSVTGILPGFFPRAPLGVVLMVRDGAYHNVPDPGTFTPAFCAANNVVDTTALGMQNLNCYMINLSTGAVTRW